MQGGGLFVRTKTTISSSEPLSATPLLPRPRERELKSAAPLTVFISVPGFLSHPKSF